VPQLDRNRLRTLRTAWRRLDDLDQSLVVPHVDAAIAGIERLHRLHEAYMVDDDGRVDDIAASFVNDKIDFPEAVLGAFMAASTESMRKAAMQLVRSGEQHIYNRCQGELLTNGKELHALLRSEYARIVARARELAPAIDGLTSGDQALHAPAQKRAAWVELVDLAERRDAIRGAHGALRGVYIWGTLPHPFDHRFLEYADPDRVKVLDPNKVPISNPDPVLVLVAEATSTTAKPALYNNAEAVENQRRYMAGLPEPEPFKIGETDLERIEEMKRSRERNHVPG
jgi:hypothetical protein